LSDPDGLALQVHPFTIYLLVTGVDRSEILLQFKFLPIP
jgi:hypothetical protein